jgi:dihydrodipicolinate synthase/N-acetylneuraminate lyase
MCSPFYDGIKEERKKFSAASGLGRNGAAWMDFVFFEGIHEWLIECRDIGVCGGVCGYAYV